MLKRFKGFLLSIMVFTLLVGCAGNTSYVPFVGEFGPNHLNSKYFYHYISKTPHFYSVLARYDVDDMEDQEIYVVNDLEKQRIKDYFGFDFGVFFVVSERKKVDHEPYFNEKTLMYHDNESEQDQAIISSKEDILFIDSKDGLKVKVDDKYYFLEKADREYWLAETTFSTENENNQYGTMLEIETEDGTKAVLSKEYKEADYKYQVGGRTGIIEALDSKYAPKSALSDNYVVENDKIIGTVLYTNINSRRFYEAEKYTYPNELKGEVLYEFDLQTCESKILYRIKGNKKLIIGYRDGQVYLYSKGKIIEHSLDSGKENVILEIEYNSEDQLSFNWLGNTIVVYNEHNYAVVGSVKVEN